jgi:hypothetical protein
MAKVVLVVSAEDFINRSDVISSLLDITLLLVRCSE